MPIKSETTIILPNSLNKASVEVYLVSGHVLIGDLDFNWDVVQTPIDRIELKIPGSTITFKDEYYFMLKESLQSLASGRKIGHVLNMGCFSSTDRYPAGLSIDTNMNIVRKRFDLSTIHPQARHMVIKK